MTIDSMRSGLTMLGILIGTAAVILLVAVGTGISQEVQSEIRDLGTMPFMSFRNATAAGRTGVGPTPGRSA